MKRTENSVRFFFANFAEFYVRKTASYPERNKVLLYNAGVLLQECLGY